MKKLTIIFLILFTQSIFSQYTIILKLVTSNGYTPNTGQASNIAFTRYPHSYPGDVVSGITVTESGTTGTYKCKGFTTYEYVKVWLSGVEYTPFDSTQVGSITSYLSSNYISKTSTQTGISGTKTLTGDWVWTSGSVTINKPYIYTSSPWYTDYSLLGNASIGWKGLNDSLYVLRDWMFVNGSKVILQSGYKIWGYSSTSPFQYDNNHFSWDASGGLELVNPLNFDSLSIRQDTVIGEATYSRYISLQRRFFNQRNIRDIYWHFANTYTGDRDSSVAVNEVYSSYNTGWSISLTTSYSNIDTLIVEKAGTYQFTYTVYARFAPAVTASGYKDDSIFIGLKDASIVGASLVTGSDVFISQHYNNTVETGGVYCITGSVSYYVAADNQIFYIRSKALVNSLAIGHTIEKSQITATLIR